MGTGCQGNQPSDWRVELSALPPDVQGGERGKSDFITNGLYANIMKLS